MLYIIHSRHLGIVNEGRRNFRGMRTSPSEWWSMREWQHITQLGTLLDYRIRRPGLGISQGATYCFARQPGEKRCEQGRGHLSHSSNRLKKKKKSIPIVRLHHRFSTTKKDRRLLGKRKTHAAVSKASTKRLARW